METAKTENTFFQIYGKTRTGKRKKWVLLECSCQVQSRGTLSDSIGAVVEPQYGKTEKHFSAVF